MEQKELRLRRVQYLICDIMDEMNAKSEKKNLEVLQQVIDHLSGAIGDLVDYRARILSIIWKGKFIQRIIYFLKMSGKRTYVGNNSIIFI